MASRPPEHEDDAGVRPPDEPTPVKHPDPDRNPGEDVIEDGEPFDGNFA